jgi:hypothetical protein
MLVAAWLCRSQKQVHKQIMAVPQGLQAVKSGMLLVLLLATPLLQVTAQSEFAGECAAHELQQLYAEW